MNTKRRATKERRESKDYKRTVSVSLNSLTLRQLHDLAHRNYRNLSGMVEVLIADEYRKLFGAVAPTAKLED